MQSESRIVPVILWMMGASASFIVAAISIRTLAPQFNIFAINSVRTGGGLVLLLLAMGFQPALRGDIDFARAPAHIPRNVVHVLGGVLWTLSITLLPLATVFSLEFTTPAWAALLAYPILRERIRRATIIGIGASLIGVLIVLRPAPHTFDVAALIPLAAALLFGLSALLTRRLTRTESVFAILFWMMTIQFPVNLVGAFALMPATAAMPMPTALEVAAMCTLAMGGLCSQLCLSKALQIGQAIIVVPLDFVRVPLIALIGWALYMEPIDLWVFVGSIVIFVGILISILPSQKSDLVIEALRSTD